MADENIAEQLWALTELVQQLRVANSKLRKKATQRPTIREVGPVEEGSPSVQFPSTSHAYENQSVSSGIVEHFVYVRRDRCPRFSGDITVDSLSVADWVEEVRRYSVLHPEPCSKQALIVFDLLEGEARAEVKFHPISYRDEAKKIFCILFSAHGCAQSSVSHITQFFQRQQREGGLFRVYSYALMSLIGSFVLRDQFIEHVRDGSLRREL